MMLRAPIFIAPIGCMQRQPLLAYIRPRFPELAIYAERAGNSKNYVCFIEGEPEESEIARGAIEQWLDEDEE